jgi:hypothetical protein
MEAYGPYVNVSSHSDQALSCCKRQVHMFDGDLVGFDTSVGKRRPLKSDMVVNSAEGRPFHRLPPNATEPPGLRKIFSRTRAKHVCLNGRTDPF